ncbi:hypothetical protein BDN72DRAFT_343124 [Pluteus cervinus]|uniref:Uncharacterized protein n=1 Tax=Pluteus cervinus TaxID=181527 RepID=A0ACD3B2R7_9AGAR|nr:hypothetical protein BDN72DRAFT_343124 [Pluteus cervinus]
MLSPQPTTLLSLPNELLLDIFRSSPDLEDELIYLGRMCRSLNSLCIPLYLQRRGIILRNIVEGGERAGFHQTLSEDVAFPNIPRKNTLEIHFPRTGPVIHGIFDALVLNFEEIPCRLSLQNSSALSNQVSYHGRNTESTSARTPALHHIHFFFHQPSNRLPRLRFFSRIEYFLRNRHIRTNIVSVYNLQPAGSLRDAVDLSQWLRGVAGLLGAILESGCRTLEIVSRGDRATSYSALWRESPQTQDDDLELKLDKASNGILTRMRAALPKFAFRLPFHQRKGLDQRILAKVSGSIQQACHLTCLVISTPILIVPPVSSWLFALLQLPTCPLTKLGFTQIESSVARWVSFFERLEACFLLKEKAVKSANEQIGSPVLKELCISRCYGIPRGSILRLLSSLNGLETIKLEVLRFESLELDPPKPEPQYFFDYAETLEYPSDPRFTRSESVLPSAAMELFDPTLPHLTSLTIPSNWAHDFPFQSSPTHLRCLFIQIQGDISTSEFWEEGGGTKLAEILPLYPPSKCVLLGLHIQFEDLYLSRGSWGGTTSHSEAETLLRANVCPLIRCLFLDEGSATWRNEHGGVSESWLCMFPDLTHVKVGTLFSGFQYQIGKRRAGIRLKTLFGGCKTLKTVEFEGYMYDREGWAEAVELLAGDAALVPSPEHSSA